MSTRMVRTIVKGVALVAVLLPGAATAELTPSFGPKQYTRTAPAPQTFTDTFSRCGNQPAQIVVVNGNPNGTRRISSSASVWLNGKQIIAPRELSQKVARIVKPVVLRDLNQLMVALSSTPQSFLTIEIDVLASAAPLSVAGSGASLLDSGTLSSALSIENTGTAAAENVTLTEITLPGGTRTIPASLPFTLGTIPADDSLTLDAAFSGTFTPSGSYPLTVTGTYSVGNAIYCFTLQADLVIPPGAPGSAATSTITAPANQISGAPFPDPPVGTSEEPPENDVFRLTPRGAFVAGATTPTASDVTPAPIGDPPAIVFLRNDALGVPTSDTAEPSGATGGGVTFLTMNPTSQGHPTAAYSTDDGATFHTLDPLKIFGIDEIVPDYDVILGDQVSVYVPQIDRFVWLIQTTRVGYRLAVASPAAIIDSAGTAWTYWNLKPAGFGYAAGTTFDFPDLSVGQTFLYLGCNVAIGRSQGLQVARISLDQLRAGGTIGIEFTHPEDGTVAVHGRLTQSTGDEVFWAGHVDDSKLRIFSLQQASHMYFWRDVGLARTYARDVGASNTPDQQNWLSHLKDSVQGNTRAGVALWFAWTAGPDSVFRQPHIEMVTVDSRNFSFLQQVQIWNDGFAFAYPSLETNGCTGEIGLSLEIGGNGTYENHAVGFWGDFVVYRTTDSAVGVDRFGDYVTIRQRPSTVTNPGNLFTAFGYGVIKDPDFTTFVVPKSVIHHVVFGRPASDCLPIVK